jgi:hypothetical protein
VLYSERVSMTSNQPTAGWYPDPHTHGTQRYWDGVQWTPYTAAAFGAGPQSAMVPAGTPVYTPWIWFVAVLPLLSTIPLMLIDWRGYLENSILAASNATAAPEVYALTGFGAGYFLAAFAGWVLAAVGIVSSYLDWRILRDRGFTRRFHWAWAFLGTTVYAIGRSVMVRRASGASNAVMWVAIVVYVIALVVPLARITTQMVAAFATLALYGY